MQRMNKASQPKKLLPSFLQRAKLRLALIKCAPVRFQMGALRCHVEAEVVA